MLGTEETLELPRRLIEAMETGDDDTVIDIMTRQYELFLAAVK